MTFPALLVIQKRDRFPIGNEVTFVSLRKENIKQEIRGDFLLCF